MQVLLRAEALRNQTRASFFAESKVSLHEPCFRDEPQPICAPNVQTTLSDAIN